MSGHHCVTLPYPDRVEQTAGSCVCGWLVVYGWGEHTWAENAAYDHIRAVDRSEPFTLLELEGARIVRPGLSL